MKLRKTWLFLSASLLLGTPVWGAGNYSAEVYEPGSNRAKKLFMMTVEHAPAGENELATVTYKNMNGEVVILEKSVLKDAKIFRTDLEQKQVGAQATIEYKDGRAYFTKTVDGKTKKDDETVKGDFVLPGNFQRYVKSKWPELMKGESVDFRFGVWDRLETVGFTLKKTDTEGTGENQKVTIRMKASSFVIAALVSPLNFKFTSSGDKMLEMSGRVAPKLFKDGKFSDLDTDVVYFYP